jgi:hypothetical protein
MAGLADIFVEVRSLASHGMASGNLSPSRFNEGITYVWILSRSTPQPESVRGIWVDSSAWQDANRWYD